MEQKPHCEPSAPDFSQWPDLALLCNLSGTLRPHLPAPGLSELPPHTWYLMHLLLYPTQKLTVLVTFWLLMG